MCRKRVLFLKVLLTLVPLLLPSTCGIAIDNKADILNLISFLVLPPPMSDQKFQQKLNRFIWLSTTLLEYPSDALFADVDVLNFFISLCQTPPVVNLPLEYRLFNQERSTPWEGRDVFAIYSGHPDYFFKVIERVIEITNTVSRHLTVNAKNTLSPRNRVLLTLLWLRSYPTYTLIALQFDISKATVNRIINCVWPVLWEFYAPNVSWPTENEWLAMQGKWSRLPNAVGAIDATSHRINVPQSEPQALYFSGNRYYHCIHTQMILDNMNNIRYIHSGFMGHMNDAQTFAHLPSIDQRGPLTMPDGLCLLADTIYPNTNTIVTKYTAAQINRMRPINRKKARKFNRILCSYRGYIERVFPSLKIFKVIGSLYRHPRWEMAAIVELCAGLAVRRLALFRSVA